MKKYREIKKSKIRSDVIGEKACENSEFIYSEFLGGYISPFWSVMYTIQYPVKAWERFRFLCYRISLDVVAFTTQIKEHKQNSDQIILSSEKANVQISVKLSS